MSYGKRQDYEETIDGRKPGDPHPHWQQNAEYFQQIMKLKTVKEKLFDSENPKHDIKNKIQLVYSGVNKDKFGNYEVLTSGQLYWHDLQGRHGKSFNFHQNSAKFKDELELFFLPVFKENKTSMDQFPD